MDPRLADRSSRQSLNAHDDQQMQSAKFSLLSALLKPEPQATKLTPNIINEFHPLLLAVAKGGHPDSPEFIKCVARMVTYIAPSRKRTAAVGQHLIKLVDSLRESSEQDSVVAALTYLQLIAVVFVCSAHPTDLTTSESVIPAAIFTSGISLHAVNLIEIAAPRHGLQAASIHKQIRTLQIKWQRAHVFSKALRLKLRAASRAAYDDWLSWLLTNNPSYYENIKHLSSGSHSHTQPSKATVDDSWYNAPISAMIPHIKGQTYIRTSDLDTSVALETQLDAELETVLDRHIDEVANIFAGPNVARFSPENHVALNGLGQPISINVENGKRRRLGPVYYGVSEKCAKSFKSAREELPALAPLPDQPSQNDYSSRNVPPPQETEIHSFLGSYPPAPLGTGSSRGGSFASHEGTRDSGPGGNPWRGGGGGNSWAGDRGRGFGNRGGAAGSGGWSRGRGAWNDRG